MQHSPASIGRQLSDRIQAAGLRVTQSQCWGVSDDGRPAEGWEATYARGKILLPTGSDEAAAAIAQRLEDAGATDVKIQPGTYNVGVTVHYSINDDSVAAVAFDTTGLPVGQVRNARGRKLTPEDKQQIRKLLSYKMSVPAVAGQLGFSEQSVYRIKAEMKAAGQLNN